MHVNVSLHAPVRFNPEERTAVPVGEKAEVLDNREDSPTRESNPVRRRARNIQCFVSVKETFFTTRPCVVIVYNDATGETVWP